MRKSKQDPKERMWKKRASKARARERMKSRGNDKVTHPKQFCCVYKSILHTYENN